MNEIVKMILGTIALAFFIGTAVGICFGISGLSERWQAAIGIAIFAGMMLGLGWLFGQVLFKDK